MKDKEQITRENKAFLNGLQEGLRKAEIYITTYPGINLQLKDNIYQWLLEERKKIINAPIYSEVSYSGEPFHESKQSPRYGKNNSL